MAAITAADVTVTVNQQDRDCAGVDAFKNFTLATVAFGDGSLTYPTGGVPLPAIGSFGLHKGIDFVAIQQPYNNGAVYKFDIANHKIVVMTPSVRTGSTAIEACANGALIENSVGAEQTARLSGVAIDTNIDLGPMREIGNLAIAAITLKLLIIGQ